MMGHFAEVRSNRPEVHRPTGRYKHIAAFKIKKKKKETTQFYLYTLKYLHTICT